MSNDTCGRHGLLLISVITLLCSCAAREKPSNDGKLTLLPSGRCVVVPSHLLKPEASGGGLFGRDLPSSGIGEHAGAQNFRELRDQRPLGCSSGCMVGQVARFDDLDKKGTLYVSFEGVVRPDLADGVESEELMSPRALAPLCAILAEESNRKASKEILGEFAGASEALTFATRVLLPMGPKASSSGKVDIKPLTRDEFTLEVLSTVGSMGEEAGQASQSKGCKLKPWPDQETVYLPRALNTQALFENTVSMYRSAVTPWGLNALLAYDRLRREQQDSLSPRFKGCLGPLLNNVSRFAKPIGQAAALVGLVSSDPFCATVMGATTGPGALLCASPADNLAAATGARAASTGLVVGMGALLGLAACSAQELISDAQNPPDNLPVIMVPTTAIGSAR